MDAGPRGGCCVRMAPVHNVGGGQDGQDAMKQVSGQHLCGAHRTPHTGTPRVPLQLPPPLLLPQERLPRPASFCSAAAVGGCPGRVAMETQRLARHHHSKPQLVLGPAARLGAAAVGTHAGISIASSTGWLSSAGRCWGAGCGAAVCRCWVLQVLQVCARRTPGRELRPRLHV
jgi:hypothetical protein